MKKCIIILSFLLPVLSQAQVFPVGSWKRPSNVSPGEYVNNLYDSLTHQCYYTFSGIVPSLWTNQPAYSWKQRGGPHDAGIIDTLGGLHMSGANNVGQDGIGSTTSTATGAMVTVTTDVNSSPLPPIQDIFMTLNPTNGENWFTLIFSTVASGGRVWVAGCTQDGMAGDGTAGSATQTKFKPVTMPNNDTIVKVEGYQMVLALSNHDSVISWGMNNSAYGLGQGASPVSNAPGYVHLPTGWHAYDIGGGGIMSYILADSATTHYKIFSWGWEYDPGYQGLGASGTVHTTPTDVTSNAFMSPMTGHTHAVKVTCNTETTYFTCADGTLWDIGGNAVGTIGNGQSLNFAIYTTNPAPYGGSQSWPYAWDESQGELMVDTIYHVLPGVTDIDTLYTAHSNSWFLYLRELNGNEWGWGRNKSTAITANQIDQNNGKSIAIIDANYSNGNIASSYPDSWTTVWPNKITWPNTTGYEISQTSSPYCVGNPSGSPCNIYSIPSTAPPTVSAGSNQTISTSSTTMAGVASGNGGSIVNYTTWTQVSGPNTAIITSPGYQNTVVSGLVTGIYTFKDSATDNNWRTNTATMTVTVGVGTQTRFYVSSSTGSDANACIFGSPCATTAHAISLMVAGDTLSLKAGDIWTTAIYPISGIFISTYSSGANPQINGSYTASGWVSLGNGIYETYIPNDRSTLNCVTLDANLAGMGRYPDTGYLTYTGLTSSTLTSAAITGFTYSYVNGTVCVRPEFSDLDTIHVNAQGSNTLTLASSPSVLGGRGNGFFMTNHYNTLLTTTRIGSYYNNWVKDSLQMYFGSAGPSGHVVKIAVLDTGIYFSGKNNVTVQGIDFEYFNQYHAFCNNVNHIYFDSCRFQYAGNNVFTTNNDSSATFRYDTMRYANNNFAYNTGASPYLVMKYCFGDSAGMWAGMGKSGTSSTYEGWAWGNAYGQLIHFCTFLNTGYNGIYFSGDSANLRHLNVQYYCMVKCDGGGIYTWDPSLAGYTYGRNVDSSIIMNGGSPGSGIVYDATDISFSVYIDNYASKTNVFGITGAFNTSAGGFNHGQNNSFTNNNWYGSGFSQFILEAVASHAPTGTVYKNNIHGSTSTSFSSIAFISPGNDLNTFCSSCDSNYYLNPVGVVSSLYAKSSVNSGTLYSLSGWQSYLPPYDAHSQFINGALSFYSSVSPSTISLGGNFKDALGNIYPGILNLGQYSSVTLIGLPSSAIQVIRGSRIVIVP